MGKLLYDHADTLSSTLKNRLDPDNVTLPSNSKELEFPVRPLRTHVELSVVVPLLDEVETLEAITEQIINALQGHPLEIIFVDDGSRDGSWKKIQELSHRFPEQVRGYRHRRNFGKAQALSTGFTNARGGKILTIDADLQDDPAEIPSLVKKLDQGFDLVSGWKEKRNDPLSKTLPSKLFNFAARFVSGLPLHDFNCGLKLYRSEVVQDLNLYGELHRFTPILAHADGYRIGEKSVAHHPRQHGVSKYGWKRFFKGFLDLITVVVLTRYLRRPGHFFGGIGLISGFTGGTILAYLSAMKMFLNQSIDSRPLFFLGLLLVLFAGQMISTGIIGEFLLRHRSSARRICGDPESTDEPNRTGLRT